MNLFKSKIVLILSCIFLVCSCSDSDSDSQDSGSILNPSLKGSGDFVYTNYAPLATKPVKVFFHIPANSNASTPIVFLFHGDERNAKDYRDALVSKAEQKNFIILATEFSETYYPTGDQYNLGNVFIDGDNPSPSTLNKEEVWTFSIIEPLFDYFKNEMQLNATGYHIIGHSAGGQFAHRLAEFKPNSRFNTIVASASGWYTATDYSVDFPYGFKKSPLESFSLSSLFSKKMYIQVGSNDNDPNSPGLRHNPQADAQGLDRLARANYFFNYSKNQATQNSLNYNWQLSIASGLNHDYGPAINYAADLIFK
ncbi:alpha/beta hydrolase-fold protein [Flavobacterium nackdongense]|uniref:Alpha/beta hydrolase n=1 Tax=Flavobacterium nackdongense TaxID=2547394 RepID=A0A4P6YAB7_9FLAO|nr:alpha/beta hydrolase-fold protein [Flavobacterium nackdongense]QBN17615.1 hypothetical protein E1750_01960 [Flavobacterium nackdongense]